MKKIGVILSGCGVSDGSEIHEAVIALLEIARQGGEAVCFAPDKPQADVINHLTGKPEHGQRNMLVEAARIARGQITALHAARADELDALIVPGGFGVAKNLSNFAEQGAHCQVDADLVRLARDCRQAGKPLGFICIAPALLPVILGEPVRLTIGNDPDTAEVVEAMGGEHVVCPVDDIVIDSELKVVTTPAYMLAQGINEAATGIEKLVARVISLA